MGLSGFVKTRDGFTFLITGQGMATIDSPSIDLVSAWLQDLPTSWRMTGFSIPSYLTLDSLAAGVCIACVVSGGSAPLHT